MKGRKPKPTALKLLEGNAGHRKLDPSAEPQAPAGIPECPPYLHAYAKEIWFAHAKMLADMGTLTLADVQIFASYCSQSAKVRLACESQNVLREGLVTETGARKRLWLMQQLQMAEKSEREASRLLDRFAVQLGIGASNRARIKITKDDGQTDLGSVDSSFAHAMRLAHGA